MAGMRRQKQYDMFDVATGNCELEDYLNQRYSENDLSSTFWIEKEDQVDELRAPKPTESGAPGTEPVVIPIQGPGVAKPKPDKDSEKAPVLTVPEGLEPETKPEPPIEATLPAADGQDSLQRSAAIDAPGLESFNKSEPSAPAPSQESVQLSESSPEPESAPAAASPPDMQELLAKFHQAAQEYQDRSAETNSEDT